MGCISAKKVCMSWEQAREMAQAGHEIKNHGWMHKNLTKLVGEEGVLKYNIMIRLFLSKQVYFSVTYFYRETGKMRRP